MPFFRLKAIYNETALRPEILFIYGILPFDCGF